MKPAALLFVGSLLANAALVGVLVARGTFGGRSAPGAEARATGSASPDRVALGAREELALTPEAWAAVSADGTRALIDRLRTAGFPPHVLRSVALRKVREEMADARRALYHRAAKTEYWKSTYAAGPYGDPEFRLGQRELAEQEKARLKDLLGSDYQPPNLSQESLANLHRRYGDLRQDTLEQMLRIESDYNDLRLQVMSNTHGIRLPEDEKMLQHLNEEMRNDVAALLTPEQLEAYDLRSSSTAGQLRWRFASIDLTEEEYRDVYRLQRAFDDEFSSSPMGPVMIGSGSMFMMGDLPPSPAVSAEQRAVAQAKLRQALLALLGEQRVAEMDRANDFSYRTMEAIASRLELPKQSVVEAYSVQKDIQQRANAIRGDRNLTPEQRSVKLTTLQQEAVTKLGNLLTARGFDAYKTNGGQWLNTLR